LNFDGDGGFIDLLIEVNFERSEFESFIRNLLIWMLFD